MTVTAPQATQIAQGGWTALAVGYTAGTPDTLLRLLHDQLSEGWPHRRHAVGERLDPRGGVPAGPIAP